MAKAKAEALTEDGRKLNKTRMVEAALSELGNASPRDIQSYITEKFGTELSTIMISSYKSNILKKQGGAISSRRGGITNDVQVGLRDIALIQELINRVGAGQLQHLIRALAKA